MKVVHESQVPQHTVTMDGAAGCTVRWLVDAEDGAPHFAMRQFDVAPGGYTPRHSHPYEHEVYVLSGEGVVLQGDREHPLRPGTVVYVAPDEVHQFRNAGTQPLRFLCLVPHVAGKRPAPAECRPAVVPGSSSP